MIEHVPVPPVIETSGPLLAHAPLAMKLTAPVPLPPAAETVKLLPNTAVAGAPVTASGACTWRVATIAEAAGVRRVILTAPDSCPPTGEMP